jgi:hypothetical protein
MVSKNSKDSFLFLNFLKIGTKEFLNCCENMKKKLSFEILDNSKENSGILVRNFMN